MRLLKVARLSHAVVIAGIMVLFTSCSSEDNDIEMASNQMRSDATSVAEAVSEVANVGEVLHLSACRNDGSGPIPPTTKLDLVLRDGATVDEASHAAEAAFTDLGYETDLGTGNVLLVARRNLDDRRGGEIRLRESSSSNFDLTLATYITPAITC